jgi:hypothetical protein
MSHLRIAATLFTALLASTTAQTTTPATTNLLGVAAQAAGAPAAAPQKPAETKPGDPQRGTASIEGTVVTQDGDRPVRKANVTLMPVTPVVNANQMLDNRQQFQTEADGRFVFKDLPAGQYSLTVQHPTYVGTGRLGRIVNQSVRLTDGQTVKDLTFRLVPAGVIRGRVSDEDGDPVARAQVAVLRQQYLRGRKQYLSAGSANTDDLGEFRVSSLAPGTYWISANRPMMMGMPQAADAKPVTRQNVRTYYPGAIDIQSASPVEVKPGDEVPLNITLLKQETTEVKGSVTLPTGDKAENGQVTFSAPNDPSPFMGFSTLLRQGQFNLRMPPGHYRVMVMTFEPGQTTMPGYVTSFVDVPPQGLQELKLQTGASFKVNVHLNVEGAPPTIKVDNIRILMMMRREAEDQTTTFLPGDTATGKIDKDATAVVERLNPGNYDVNYFGGFPGYPDAYLKSVMQGNRDVLTTGFRVSGDVPMSVVISLNGAYVEGNVSDANQKPVKGAYVVDVPSDEFRSREQFYRVATTDQNGHFTIHALRPGRHMVVALEDPEPGIWTDAEFLKTVEGRGERFSIGDKESKQFQLQLVPKTQMAAGQ